MTDNVRAVVQVRLTARDLKRVEALAAHDQGTVSDFVRRLIGSALREDGTGPVLKPGCTSNARRGLLPTRHFDREQRPK